MKSVSSLILGATVVTLCFVTAPHSASAQPHENALVRIAELEIDPLHLDDYKTLLKQEIEVSIRIEPGVLTLYAVAVKGRPNQIRLFEMYRDEAAYRAHLESPHFKRYKAETMQMVKSLVLTETEPISLDSKFR